jgi:2-dehydro-3-deoxyphosphogluconate aldolase/(4S)-4-hydroxy-2-oxoglutarate aldolase
MTKEAVRAAIEATGIVPAIRVPTPDDALFAAVIVFTGGIQLVELTMTVPDGVRVISELRRSHPDLLVGAGTVLDVDTAAACLDAGAAFLTSPGFEPSVAAYSEKRNVAFIPGALTPSEVMMAWKTGADFVKVFPCSFVGGPPYIRALRAPFPHIPMIASGGVNQQTAADFIRAGAAAIGIGEELIPAEAVHNRDRQWISELTHRFLGIVKRARTMKPTR